MENNNVAAVAEAAFRVVLGLRFLSSGVSNVRRWPHATETAAIVSQRAATPFGLVATALMVLGGGGLALGLATRASALLLAIFLIPTFRVHHHQKATLIADSATVEQAIADEGALRKFRVFQRHAIHSHETGVQENLVYLAACLYFITHGSAGYSIDELFRSRR